MKAPAVRTRPNPAVCLPTLDTLETLLREYLGDPAQLGNLSPRTSARGRPVVLPAALLWTGLLVCVLRGFRCQLELWRLLTQWGLWHFPRVEVCDMAVYKRLERSDGSEMQTLF